MRMRNNSFRHCSLENTSPYTCIKIETQDKARQKPNYITYKLQN